MDIGTILLIATIVAGILDALILVVGPKIENYERYSIIASFIGFIAATGTLLWMGTMIFLNQFQYEYVTQVTNIEASLLLKISALWAGQSGSLIFWTFLSFILYFGFRLLSRGYEDDKLVYRAAIIMVVSSVLVAVNALAADPFRLIEGIVPSDGHGLNPLLSTIWNVIHPPIIFIAYALILVPFSIKIAGFTLRSEERNKEPIPVINAYVRFTTVFAWLMLSAGIAIGGYWAYIVLGWGGYWAWDPVETTSLIPWLLLTAYYHARPIFRKNDVLRDSFLVMAYVTVIFATWVTRSGILNSVHGFGISIVSWTMLATLLFTLILGSLVTTYSGYRDMSDDETEEVFGFFKEKDIRLLSIKTAFIGLLIVAATSTVGVAYPAVFNLGMAILDPANLADNQIGIGIEFFQYGFYAACVFLVGSAFFCLKSRFLNNRVRLIIMLSLFTIGGIMAGLSVFGGAGPLPTNFWPANLLVLPAVGAIAFLVIAFVRQMIGKDKIVSTREIGRLMLHLGLIILLLGVFMSEHVVYESNAGFVENSVQEIAPGTYIQVTDINLQYWVNERDFNMVVTLQVIEIDSSNNSIIVGIGYAVITGNPDWNMITHQVYLQTNAFRDIFIAVTGFTLVAPNIYQVTVHTKILPLVSFVWLGAFLMISAMLPMFGIETQALLRAFKGKEKDLYEDIPEDSEELAVEN
ncbi:MAG: cytochrome c biogenesis protein CcsA [Candidatus Thorarchaeota archaeon]|nr:cytochrome c biogenesis protein CcsA [Candidatus Thorarchaeota archaeon]